jgi:hypothetical protein
MLLAMIKSRADQQPAVRAFLGQEYYFRARSLWVGLSLTFEWQCCGTRPAALRRHVQTSNEAVVRSNKAGTIWCMVAAA